MPHRPLARRAPQLRRALPAVVAVAALAGTGCRGAGAFKISPISDAMTNSTLLGCVAEVAAERGLPVIEQRAEAEEPTLFARSASLEAPHAADPRRVDMLTVSFKKLGRGLKVLAQTFVVRGQPAASGAVASAAALPVARPAANVTTGPVVADDTPNDGTLWQATQPSLRVAEARDAVLARCGSLGP